MKDWNTFLNLSIFLTPEVLTLLRIQLIDAKHPCVAVRVLRHFLCKIFVIKTISELHYSVVSATMMSAG